MFSRQPITKGAALALVFGAVAGPAASAAPIAPAHSCPRTLLYFAASPGTPSPLAYSRQDKQFVSSRPSPPPATPGTVVPSTGMGQTGAAAGDLAAYRLHTRAQTSVAATSPSDGFDWGDAGIGAAAGLALAVLGVGGGLALIQRRSGRTRTPAVVTG
jgi:hypothetical protein